MTTHCLPYLCANADVLPHAVGMAHASMRRLPTAVVAALWRKKYGVYLRGSFDDWDKYHGESRKPYGHSLWATCGGYWDEDTGYAVVNAKWCASRQGHMDAVVLHEVGHALSINILGRPHRQQPFRDAWRRGRDVIRAQFPEMYASKEGLGIFTIQWTRAVAEVWAESFAWILHARDCTHPAFGDVFADCIEMVRADVGAMRA